MPSSFELVKDTASRPVNYMYVGQSTRKNNKFFTSTVVGRCFHGVRCTLLRVVIVSIYQNYISVVVSIILL